MGWLIILSNFLAAGIRVIVCLFLISRLLSAKKIEKKSIALALASAAVIAVLASVLALPELCHPFPTGR